MGNTVRININRQDDGISMMRTHRWDARAAQAAARREAREAREAKVFRPTDADLVAAILTMATTD